MRRISALIIAILCLLSVLPVQAQGELEHLGDSLTAFTGFSSLWSPPVRVKSMRVNGNKVTLRTNATLKDVRWTSALIRDIKRDVSRWVLGHENGIVTIYSANTDIETLVTDCAKGILVTGKQNDLTERNIALWPSHGLYFNRDRNEWIWQRATLWTTVEDLYSQEYIRLVRKMLENAGATVYMPRAGLEHQEQGLSGMPQWTEGARYWLIAQGADSTIWDLYEGDEYKDDMKCRALWVNSLDVPIDLCMALHTDGLDSGDDSTIVGSLCIYTAKDDSGHTVLRDGRDRERINRNLGDFIQTQLTQDVRHIAPEWTRRQLKEANYCESRVPVVPCVLMELLSHKNMADMKYGLDPKFRFTAARALYKGILKYLNGKSAVVQPLPVQQLAIDTKGILRWQAPVDTLEPTATPSYYMVYVQANEDEWNVQQVEKKTEIQLPFLRGVQYNYYVVAGNDGGLSLPSPVISAYWSERDESPTALIVDGFDDVYGPEWFADSTYAGIVPGSYACEDRFSCAYIGEQWNFTRSSMWLNDDNCGWGSCYRDHAGQLTIGNTRDWSTRHGHVLRKMRISYVSCTADFFRADSTFALVDYICGRQRQPIPFKIGLELANYLHTGGRLLLSTDHLSAIDPVWTKQVLHTSYYAAKATHNGHITSPLHRFYQLVLTPNEEQLFTCTPEGLKPEGEEAVPMAKYQDMRCTAAVGVPHKSLVYGFPLEAVTDFEKIYKRSIEWLLE